MKKIFLTVLISSAAFAQNKLEEVASFGKNQPIGVTVETATNRLFVSFPHNEPFLYGLTEIKNGVREPYPDTSWNQYNPEAYNSHFYNVQDLYADDKGYLWMLDSKPSGAASVFGDDGKKEEGKFKLVKIKLANNTVERIYHFSGLNKVKSGLNDIRVDTDKNLAYLSDPGQAAIIVLNLETDTIRVVLEKKYSTTIEPAFVLEIEGVKMIDEKGNPFKSNVNGIALTKDNKYFYYKPINKNELFRIETKYLADASLSEKELNGKVERIANTGVTHGLVCDKKGNVYFGSSPEHSIKYVSPDGKVHTLVTDDRIIWPDSFGVGSNNYLYFSCAQLNRIPKWNNGTDRVDYPFRVFRVKMP
ncbi:SMP-30/gluconolactonase/LRE family protein [Flavobacterium rhizosphaerae]|uniref:L-dopachrome tautomerase-related protein n=1 Tax=Flavobacterium rhizosphaerae TaxID=3163298 RepID=A0ABW8YSC5_9FLAO